MRFKKIATLIAGLGLLCSCSGSGYYGKYSFGMGKTTSTSFNVSMELTREKFETTIVDLAERDPKYFNFDFQITGIDEEEIDLVELLDLINSFKDEETDTFRGFYYVTPQEGKNTNQLCIGFQKFIDLLERIQEIIPEIEIDYNIFEKIVFCTIDGKNIEMGIPVSLTDLCFQLAWYGLYISPLGLGNLNFNLIHSLDFGSEFYKHVPSYNIKDEDIEKMNNNFAAYFCNTVVEYDGENVAGLYVDKKDKDNPKTKLLYYPESIGVVDDLDGKEVTIISADGSRLDCVINLASGDIVKSFYRNSEDITSLVSIDEKTVYRKTHVVHVGLQKE